MSHQEAFQDGLLAAQAGKQMIARLQFEQVAEVDPSFVPNWLWLAWTADSPEKAIGYLDQATELEPNNRLASVYREVMQAFANFDVNSDYADFLVTAPSGPVDEQQRSQTDDLPAPQDASCELPSEPEPKEASEQPEAEPVAVQEENTQADNIAPEVTTDGENDTDTKDFEAIQLELAAIREKTKSPDQDNEKAGKPTSDTTAFDEINWDESDSADETATAPESDKSQAEEPAVVPTVEAAPQAASEDTEQSFFSEDSPAEEAVTEESIAADVNDINTTVQSSLDTDTSAEPKSDEVPIVENTQEQEKKPQATAPVVETNETETSQATSSDASANVSDDSEELPTILIVDDSPTVRKLVTMTLKSGGYNVRTAEDGVEAMKMLATFTPSLILLDVNMPRMDGYKLCKLIKRHDKTKFIPVVMLSGKDGMFDKLRGTLVGCNDYISKPFKSAELLRHIEQYVFTPAG